MSRWLLRSAPLALALLASPLARADAPDWEGLREVETVTVVTRDEDGGERETTVWLVVVDGAGYVRTGGTRWGGNLARTPELVLRSGEVSYPLRVDFVEDDVLRQRVADAFREKYGFSDRALGWVRGPRPKIMRLGPKE